MSQNVEMWNLRLLLNYLINFGEKNLYFSGKEPTYLKKTIDKHDINFRSFVIQFRMNGIYKL